MIKEELRFAKSNIFEGMTSISALLDAIKRGVNDRPIHEICVDREKLSKKSREVAFLRARCEELQLPLRVVDAEEIRALCVGNTHGGIIALCGERTLPSPTPENLPNDAFLAYLEGIEDPYNFGYALRSLYAAGCDGILLGTRNWMSAAGVVARASAGASEAMPIYAGDADGAIDLLAEKGYRIVCAGIRNSVPYHEADLKKPLLLVVGGEKRGISAKLLAKAHQIVRIDYGRDFRGSLSTASATTVIGFEVLRQNHKQK